jgi:hypothetical protein
VSGGVEKISCKVPYSMHVGKEESNQGDPCVEALMSIPVNEP